MIMQLLGGCVVVSAATRIGFDLAKKLDKRVEQLNDLKLGISTLQTAMTFKNIPLPEALRMSSDVMQTEASELFASVGSRLAKRSGATVREAFGVAVKENSLTLSLTKDDYNIIDVFSVQLGASDLKSQLENIDFTRSRLDNAIEIAQGRCTKYSKLYRTSGFLSGLFVVILFL